ncbi:MAG TPA: alcohol dehydrogenase catalytic domain-containing protein [Actinomycetota bacterium]|nr:alcohol dehydrogenase catalytic domain-containing protein [Actinomycetota bacterium]
MRAALLDAPRTLGVREADDPTPTPGDAVVRVEAVGICGTDLSIFAGKIPVRYPRVIGHEIVGVLEDPGGSGIAAGTRVLVDPAISCGSCRQCREGRTNICTRGALLGRDRDGGLRERLAVPPANVHELPPAVEPSVAPMIQVLATCVHAQRRMPLFLGERVVVLGLGVTGLLHVQLAKRRGAGTVVGVTRSEAKLSLAGELGADALVRADGSETEEVERTLGGGADLVVECIGTVGGLARAVELVRHGGRILAYGTITETVGELSFYDLYHKEISIQAARAARPEDFPDSISLVAAGEVSLGPLVSDRFPFDRSNQALGAAGAPGALKVLVDL